MPNDHIALTSGGWAWSLSYVQTEDCHALNEMEEPQRAQMERLAVDFLWRWTQQKFGTKEVSVRPVTASHDPRARWSRFYGFGPYSTGSSGPYVVPASGGRAENVLYLPRALEVEEVMVDGEPLSPESYVLDKSLLVRTDGGSWPLDQDPTDPPTEDGTFEVTYKCGREVPPGGEVAAGVLACEFAKAAQDDPECGLPQRVQSVTRQGVTVAVMDQFEDVDQGHTGIWLIDSWVASIIHPPRPAKVISPDYRSAARRSPLRLGR